MIVYQARWILPIVDAPIEGGWIAVERGRVIALGQDRDRPTCETVDLHDTAIMPAAVNAHTHLEFSDLDKPIGYQGIALHDWIGAVVRTRAGTADQDRSPAMMRGLRQCLSSGTALVGDIATTPVSPGFFDAPESMDAVSFAEVLGLDALRSDLKHQQAIAHIGAAATNPRVTIGVSPHAPYSTPLPVVQRCVEMARGAKLPIAMHVAESVEERRLIESGDGPFADRLKQMRVYRDDVFPWGRDATSQLIAELALAPQCLLIHGNDLRAEEIALVAKNKQMTIVYCPRTHAYFGHPRHPVASMRIAGVRVALGTDSLASNPDLNLWGEVQWLLGNRQDLPWHDVIEMATLAGADALGRPDLGRITPGATARFVVVPTSSGGVAESLLTHLPKVFPTAAATS